MSRGPVLLGSYKKLQDKCRGLSNRPPSFSHTHRVATLREPGNFRNRSDGKKRPKRRMSSDRGGQKNRTRHTHRGRFLKIFNPADPASPYRCLGSPCGVEVLGPSRERRWVWKLPWPGPGMAWCGRAWQGVAWQWQGVGIFPSLVLAGTLKLGTKKGSDADGQRGSSGGLRWSSLRAA